MSKTKESIRNVSDEIHKSIRTQCNRTAGPMDGQFLCSSVSLLEPPEPVILQESATLSQVMEALQKSRIGCNVLVNSDGVLTGIFSERDYLLKVYGKEIDSSEPIERIMTKDPVVIALDETIAYALTLMSQGGFRNLPITDESGCPIGIISVKDIVDYLSGKVLEDLLADMDVLLEDLD